MSDRKQLTTADGIPAGAYGTFTVTYDITQYTKAKLFSKVGKQTPTFPHKSTNLDIKRQSEQVASPK